MMTTSSIVSNEDENLNKTELLARWLEKIRINSKSVQLIRDHEGDCNTIGEAQKDVLIYSNIYSRPD